MLTPVNDLLVGVISDTHGLLRPQAVEVLQGVNLLLHAGDIGSPAIIEALRSIAPVVGVRGNNDTGAWAIDLPASEVVEVGAICIYVLHNLKELDRDPAMAGFRAVVSGHSHRPSIQERGGVLFLNPGSAGPRRFKLPVSVARLRVHGPSIAAEIIELEV
jgi:putative phosphoesterase